MYCFLKLILRPSPLPVFRDMFWSTIPLTVSGYHNRPLFPSPVMCVISCRVLKRHINYVLSSLAHIFRFLSFLYTPPRTTTSPPPPVSFTIYTCVAFFFGSPRDRFTPLGFHCKLPLFSFKSLALQLPLPFSSCLSKRIVFPSKIVLSFSSAFPRYYSETME